jgi:hypothetical protein
MQAIETLLRECGEQVVYAVDARGERVTPATAYRARLAEPATAGVIYEVECMVLDRASLVSERCITIDHHRPGDPGYGRPPSEFLAASSIGQVIAELAHTRTTSNLFNYDVVLDNAQWSRIEAGTHHDHTMSWGCDDDRIPDVEVDRFSDLGDPLPTVVRLLEQSWPTPFAWVAEIGAYIICTPRGGFELGGSESWHVVPADFVLTAAADHCLGAAYRGKCPGVDPDALMRWRAESRARYQRRSVEAILADVERAKEALQNARRLDLVPGVPCCQHLDCPECAGYGTVGGVNVRDMRGQHVPELPEAATRLGLGYVADVRDGRDGRRKIVCSGDAEQVRAFLEVWAPAQGLLDLYGDPARGFAGGYVAEGIKE